MFKLIQLEVRKHKLFSYLKSIIIANLIIIATLALMYVTSETVDDLMFTSLDEAFKIIHILVKAVFMIFTAMIIVRVLIEEFKMKTIQVMFMYPLSRRQIILAKVMVIFSFALITISVSEVVLEGLLLGVNSIFPILTGEVTAPFIWRELMNIVMSSLAAAGISLIPIYFGMRKYSVSLTFISGIILSSLFNSNSNGYTLSSNLWISIIFVLIGLGVSWITIMKVQHKDIV
ncbi:ABC-type transport system involved in multi-copper enzyme maturation permease subunit [Paenibacillus shirakamiensis]|uniref:ABC-type transport system involved in multi-copper enzyme maturation permease subunit n=1 Tax=Paenibacillus shirakamiensis TaxID=1265935 RepID=A0ABS4JIZ1_9BACL|nr:ABC transporter permease [Paenibacillus shirakamiensis]MBP2001668.1 ABC-type transport system involved in multi-copper enzyme maturation permease subunit [Paenibacillus shirakamiensis]